MVVDHDNAAHSRVCEQRSVDLGNVAGAEGVEENEFAVLRAGQQSALTRRKGTRLWLLRQHQEAFDVKPRNVEQRLALDLLLDPEVSVVALDGPAGTGKTLLAIAAGLEPSLAKTVLTRAAEGTKVVFTGDTSQIDAPFLSAHNNAMSVLTAALGGGRGGGLFGHVRLAQGERSAVATMAAGLL